MNFKIKDLLFVDTNKAGKPQINKAGDKFWMLHLEILEQDENSVIQANEHGKWISKYYVTDEGASIKDKIKVGKTYMINYSQTGQWKNIVSIATLDGNILI